MDNSALAPWLWSWRFRSNDFINGKRYNRQHCDDRNRKMSLPLALPSWEGRGTPSFPLLLPHPIFELGVG